MKKVIVTGGAGYIGSHTVVELAKSGFEAVILDDLRNSNRSVLKGIENILGDSPRFHEVDIADENALDRIFTLEGPIFGVIHFAALKAVAESVAEPLKYYDNNLSSTFSLLRVMQRNAVKSIVFSSSCTVYGETSELPVDESAPDRQAESPYGWTKVMCEQILKDAHLADPTLQVVLLRYFNPIGAHPTGHIGELPTGVPSNLVPFVTQTAAGLRKSLTIHGNDYNTVDGTCVRDFIHVVDLAKAHVKALNWMVTQKYPVCEAFNIGTGEGASVKQVVDTFQEVNGVEVPHHFGPRRPGDIEQIWANVDKSKQVLGWQTEKSLKEALRDAWLWECRLRKTEQV
jgi:UDP-glucose 4-epimerase